MQNELHLFTKYTQNNLYKCKDHRAHSLSFHTDDESRNMTIMCLLVELETCNISFSCIFVSHVFTSYAKHQDIGEE